MGNAPTYDRFVNCEVVLDRYNILLLYKASANQKASDQHGFLASTVSFELKWKSWKGQVTATSYELQLTCAVRSSYLKR